MPSNSLQPEWYLSDNGQLIGPLSAEQLVERRHQKKLLPGSLLQAPGSTQWLRADSFPFLYPTKSLNQPASLDQQFRNNPLSGFSSKKHALSLAHVVPDADRCVQCGICSFNCPMGIDVRAHAWRGDAIYDSHCLICTQCVQRCPRGVLEFQELRLFEDA